MRNPEEIASCPAAYWPDRSKQSTKLNMTGSGRLIIMPLVQSEAEAGTDADITAGDRT